MRGDFQSSRKRKPLCNLLRLCARKNLFPLLVLSNEEITLKLVLETADDHVGACLSVLSKKEALCYGGATGYNVTLMLFQSSRRGMPLSNSIGATSITVAANTFQSSRTRM